MYPFPKRAVALRPLDPGATSRAMPGSKRPASKKLSRAVAARTAQKNPRKKPLKALKRAIKGATSRKRAGTYNPDALKGIAREAERWVKEDVERVLQKAPLRKREFVTD